MTKAVVTTTSFGATSSNNFTGAPGTTHERRYARSTNTINNSNRSSINSSPTATIFVGQEEAAATNMNAEIDAAVSFLTYLLVKAQFSRDSAELFRKALTSLLKHHYVGHWYPQEPLKGSGYRCLRVNGVMHPLLAKAADLCKFPLTKVRRAFPAELTVWVDPGDVSVRFGEEGSIGVFYAKPESAAGGHPKNGTTTTTTTTTKQNVYRDAAVFTSELNAVNNFSSPKQQQQCTISPSSTSSRNSPLCSSYEGRTPPSSKSSSSQQQRVWNYGGGRQTPTSSAFLLNGSYNSGSCGGTASTTYDFGYRFDDHQYFSTTHNVGGFVPHRISPTPAPAAALSNEAACKIEYQLYGNVHMGSGGVGGANGVGRLTPSSIAMSARMEPVSAN